MLCNDITGNWTILSWYFFLFVLFLPQEYHMSKEMVFSLAGCTLLRLSASVLHEISP